MSRQLFAVILSILTAFGFAVCPRSAPLDKSAVYAGPLGCEHLAAPFVIGRLLVWQQRLKLDDWKIVILMVHPSDLKTKTLGNIHWNADTKSAVIRVLDASDYQLPCRDMLDDMEFTVVHELIHLELASLVRSDDSRRDEEFAINQIVDALLKLYRPK